MNQKYLVDVRLMSQEGDPDVALEVPALLDEVERLQAENEQLKAVFGDLRQDSPAAQAIFERGALAERQRKDVFDGVAILRYHDHDPKAREAALHVAQGLCPGSRLCLPNTRDYSGEYVWDLQIVSGKFNQVAIQRTDDSTPELVT